MGFVRKTKRVALTTLLVILGLVVVYYGMKWTTPKNCIVPINRMSQDCKDFIYPQ